LAEELRWGEREIWVFELKNRRERKKRKNKGKNKKNKKKRKEKNNVAGVEFLNIN
jgi:hypothetical protein